MKKKTKSLIVSFVLAFAMLLSAPFALVKIESAKAYGVTEVAPETLVQFTATCADKDWYSPKVATVENGLSSNFVSYENKGIITTLFKEGDGIAPDSSLCKVITKSFDASQLTKDQKLIEFLPVGDRYNNWRAYRIAIGDGTNTINVYLGNKQSDNTGYGNVKGGDRDAMYVQAGNQSKLGGLTNGAAGTFIDNAPTKTSSIDVTNATGTPIDDSKPIAIFYDATEKAIYTNNATGQKVLVRDLDATDVTNGNDSAFAGFSGPVTVTFSHNSGPGGTPTGGYTGNTPAWYGVLITALNGVDLATDADGKIIDTYRYADGKISASPYKNLDAVTVVEGENAPVSAPVRKDAKTLEASEKENWVVTAVDADGDDVTATVITGLADGKWAEDATITPTRGTTVVTMTNGVDTFTQSFVVAGLKQAKITVNGATGDSSVKIADNACADFTDVAEGEVAVVVDGDNQVCLSLMVNGVERVEDIEDGVLTLSYDELTYKTEIVATFSAIWTMNLVDGENAIGSIITAINTAFTKADADEIVAKEGYTHAYKVDNADYDWATIAEADATVTVVYTPISYTVAVEADGGSCDPAPEYPATVNVETVLALPVLVKDGYTFHGWFLDDEFTTAVPAEAFANAYEFEVDGTITFYAKFTLDEFTIAYDGQGGTLTGADTKYSINNQTVSLATATRVGYTFDGWYAGETLVESATYDDVKAGLALVAKWTAIEYDLVFMANGAQVGSTIKFTVENTVLELPEPPVKEHYAFSAWMYGVKIVKDGAFVFPAENMEIVAVYAPIEYEIICITNGGKFTNAADYLHTVETDWTAVELPNVTRNAFDFGGWFTDAEFTVPFDKNAYVFTPANVTLYAKWIAQEYTVTFQIEGEADQTDTYTSDAVNAIAFPTAPNKTYFEFVGWFNGEDEVTAEGFDYTAGNLTLVAKYEEIKYAVVWNTNGGTITETEYTKYITISDVNGGSIVISVPTVEKEGYLFGGWFVDTTEYEDADTFALNASFLSTETPATFTASWTPVEYTITYSVLGGTMGSEAKTVTFTVEDTEIALPSVTKEGVIFLGWFDAMGNDGVLVESGDFTFPAKNFTLYAKYDVENYNVIFTVENAQFDIINIVKGAPITKTTLVPTKDGYDFVGWFLGDTAYTFGTAITANVTLTAKFELVTYQIVFDANGGTVDTEVFEFNAQTTAITVPTPVREGYEFDGWYYNGVKVDPATYVPTVGNKTFEAHWIFITEDAPAKEGCAKEAVGLLAVVLSALAVVLVIKKK